MTALLIAQIRETLTAAPFKAIVGSLKIKDAFVFGDGRPIDGDRLFEASDLSWDSHCWLEIDSWILDVSIFRTAYSSKSPPLLKTFVLQEFGRNRGVLIGDRSGLSRDGLHYIGQYELSKVQINRLLPAAVAKLA